MKKIIVSTVLMVASSTLYAQDMDESFMHEHHHSHSEAPIGVMGGHTHSDGDVMFTYRYMTMHMDGNRDGKKRISQAEVLANYMVTPTSMDMSMHMFGAMYAPTNKLTLMAMLPYVKNSMKHVTRTGRKFTTNAEGIGDVKVSGLYKLLNHDVHQVHLNMGISLPTGSIDEHDDTPAANDAKLPYPMQLGSGTYDLMPGITYLGNSSSYSWGAQALATIRLGENNNDYTLGNKVELTSWLERKWSSSFSTSLRVKAQRWGDIDGADPDLNPMMISTADPELRAGSRADILVGFNYNAHKGAFKGNRLTFEIAKPVYQKLDGPQLETDLILTAGWQYSF